jgi:hypothetical protein
MPNDIQPPSDPPVRSSELVRPSPRQRLESALDCIKNARVRLQIRRIYESEIPNASIFWDVDERQVELIANDWEIIIRERDDRCRPNAGAKARQTEPPANQ